MVDETAGDDGRNGTGGDRGNVALSNSTFRPTSDSRTHAEGTKRAEGVNI